MKRNRNDLQYYDFITEMTFKNSTKKERKEKKKKKLPSPFTRFASTVAQTWTKPQARQDQGLIF